MSQRFGFSRRSKRLAVVIAGLLVLSVVGVALAAAVTIDTFDTDEQNLVVDIGTPLVGSVVASTSALGGERDVLLQWLSGNATVRVDNTDSNRLAFSQEDASTAIATITWDGVDAPGTELDRAQTNAFLLGSVNLQSSGPANDVIHLEVPFNDLKADVRIRVFTTDATNYFEYTIHLPGGIAGGSHVDFVVPFASFSTVGTPSWADVDAIEMRIDGTIQAAADLSIDYFDVDTFREYGDLPTSGDTATGSADYSVDVLNAYHTPVNGLRLGGSADSEGTHNQSALANGDDTHQAVPDDEDGVQHDPDFVAGPYYWNPTNGGSLQVDINPIGSVAVPVAGIVPLCGAAPNQCYLNFWFDWNNDGDFGDGGESYTRTYVNGGTKTVAVPLTITPTGTYYARFRLCGGVNYNGNTCNSPTGNVNVGEVEDYVFTFGPNAVTMERLEAKADTQNNTAALILAATVVAALGLAGAALRRRTA